MKQAFFEARTTKELCKVLGLPPTEAPKVEMRRNLVMAIKRSIDVNGWTHAEAGKRSGVGRTVITSVVNGNIGHISTDKLIDIAQRVGLQITLKVA